jgi:hypothetical protein
VETFFFLLDFCFLLVEGAFFALLVLASSSGISGTTHAWRRQTWGKEIEFAVIDYREYYIEN